MLSFRWSAPALEKRADLVLKNLRQTIPHPAVPLDHSDHFTLLVAVILSAQCTDLRVNQVTKILFKRAKTPQAIAAMKEKELYDIIKPCGLGTSKAPNLIATAGMIVKKHKGQVPNSREELEALPGVGRKTANVILAQAFGIPSMPVDTHILRSAQRWGLSRGKTPEKVEHDLCAIYPAELWNSLHLQIILYARAYCTARGCPGPRADKMTANQKRCGICQGLRKQTSD